jgi:hypothetical protein
MIYLRFRLLTCENVTEMHFHDDAGRPNPARLDGA